MKPSFHLRRGFVCVCVTFSTAALAGAQTWNATTGGNWSDSTKWTPNTVPDAIGAAVTISTNITATQTVTIDTTSRTVGTLLIGDATTRSNSFTLAASGGASLILDNGASDASITSSTLMVNQTISAPLLLRSATTRLINSNNDSTTARVQTYSGTISTDTAGLKTIVVSGASVRANVTISSAINNGSGTLALTKESSNILILSGTSNYSGGTSLTAGTLLLNSAASIGTGALTITGGGIGTTSGSAVTLGSNNVQNWNGNFAIAGSQTLNLGTGLVTMSASRSISMTGSGSTGSVAKLVIGGQISDGGSGFSLTTTGSNGAAATLEIAGDNTLANSYSGGTNINGGIVRFANSNAVPTSGMITIGANGSLAVGGAYTTLAGWIGSGKVSTGSTGSLGLESSSSEAWDPAGVGYGSLSLGAALGSSVVYTGAYTPAGGTYRIGGGGGTIEFSNTNAFTGSNALVAGGGGGGRVLISSSNGSLDGDVTVKSGSILALSNSNAIGTGANAVTVEAGGSLELTGGITISGRELIASGTSSTASPTNVISSLTSASGDNEWTGAITANTSNNVRFTSNSGATLRLSGDVALSGSGSMVLTGSGTGIISGDISGDVGFAYTIIQNGGSNWTLTGNNTFTDSVRIDNGSISVGSIATNLGNSTADIGLGETTGTGTLIYTGTGETTARGFILRSVDTSGSAGGGAIEQAGTGLLKITGNITSSSTTAAKTLTLTGSTAGTGEIAGTISNSASGATRLTKTGSGAWTLSNTNGYTGATTVSGGTLTVTGSINSTTSLAVTNGTFAIGASDAVNNAATVGLGANSVLQIAGFTESLGALTVSGSSIINLLGDGNLLTFASGNISGGSLAVTGWNGSVTGGGSEQLVFTSNTTIGSQLSSVTFINPEGFAAGTYSAKFIGMELVPDALIPEPTVWISLMTGGGMLCLRRRRSA